MKVGQDKIDYLIMILSMPLSLYIMGRLEGKFAFNENDKMAAYIVINVIVFLSSCLLTFVIYKLFIHILTTINRSK